MSGRMLGPRHARSLLERTLPPDVREDVIGDLDEVYVRRCATHGVARARLWYWREALSFAGRFLRERARDRGGRSGGGGTGVSRSRLAGGASWLDVKLGLRMLVKYPGLTLVGALGIAVAVALAASWFEFSRDLSSPRLPFEEQDRIVRIRNWDAEAATPEPRMLHDFVTWRRELVTIDDLGAASPGEVQLMTESFRSASVSAASMTASVFRMLRVPPLLGRSLIASDEEPGAPSAAVIGYDLWQRLFEGDRSIIGRTVRLGNGTSTVVGVMPPGFGFPVNHEIWIPLRADPLDYARREGPQISVVGRLAPGVTQQEAQAELTAIGIRLAAEFPETNERLRPRVGPYVDLGPEAMLATAANLVFIILLFVVCANIATLVFARTVTREGEIALRSALGASRGRIVFQLFTEALVLTSAASAAGLAAAAWGMGWGMDLFWDVQQSRPPFWFDSSLSLATALYIAGLAIFGAAAIGVVPALRATGRRIQPRLALVGSGGSRLKFGRVSTAVIVVQVALCVAFLPFAIVEGRELLPDQRAREAFPAEAYLSGRLTRQLDVAPAALPVSARTALRARTAELQDEARRRLFAEPGVAAITFADRLPGMNHPAERIRIEGDAVASRDSAVDRPFRTLAVDLEFFETMNARVVSGRAFRAADLSSDVDVIVVGESFARDVLQGRNAVGQRVRFPDRREGEAERWYEIVGVVEDPAIVAFGAGEYVGLYRPLAPGELASVQIFLRAAANADALVTLLPSIVSRVDPALTIDGLASMSEIWSPVRRSNRLFVTALVAVGGIAVLLSLAGIYALMSFTVAQRTREIAIRAALGAHPRRIVGAIFSRALLQIGLGVVAGAALVSFSVADAPNGAAIVAAVAALMMGVGLLACALPAIRALRVHPSDAFRNAA